MEADHIADSSNSNAVRDFDSKLPLQRGIFPRPYCISSVPHKDITMQGVEGLGDFAFYQGVWRIQALPNCAPPGSSAMRLTYSVELSPKVWVPVQLLEGQIANTLGQNLVSIREFSMRPEAWQRYTAEPFSA